MRLIIPTNVSYLEHMLLFGKQHQVERNFQNFDIKHNQRVTPKTISEDNGLLLVELLSQAPDITEGLPISNVP